MRLVRSGSSWEVGRGCEDGKFGKRLFPGLGHADRTAAGEGSIEFNAVDPGEDDGGAIDAVRLLVAVPQFDSAKMAEIFVGMFLYR